MSNFHPLSHKGWKVACYYGFDLHNELISSDLVLICRNIHRMAKNFVSLENGFVIPNLLGWADPRSYE